MTSIVLQQELKLAQAYFTQLARASLKDKAILLDEVLVQRKRSKASVRSQNLKGRGNADFVFWDDLLQTCLRT